MAPKDANEQIEALIEQFDDGGLSRGESEAYVYCEVLGLHRRDAADELEKNHSTVATLNQRAKNKIKALDAAREQAERWKAPASITAGSTGDSDA